MKKAIILLRVSSRGQQRSGLGLAAQRRQIHAFAATNRFEIVGEFIERVPGWAINRPIVEKTLAECKRIKATLLIAKVDRLSRRVLFIAILMESQIPFIAVDKPYADEYELHMEAANAQRESRIISQRTKAALQEAKHRGVKLGTSIWKVLKGRRREYKAFAKKMRPVIKKFQSKGICSVRQLTNALNKRHIRTFTGGDSHWHVSTVHTLLKNI